MAGRGSKCQHLVEGSVERTVFNRRVKRLDVDFISDFGISAAILLRLLWRDGVSMALDLWEDSGAKEFVMMVSLGFFKRTRNRYQMILPSHLDIEVLKSAALELARTEDREYELHPEALVVWMSEAEARSCRKRLRDMDQDLRIGKRCRLLREAV